MRVFAVVLEVFSENGLIIKTKWGIICSKASLLDTSIVSSCMEKMEVWVNGEASVGSNLGMNWVIGCNLCIMACTNTEAIMLMDLLFYCCKIQKAILLTKQRIKVLFLIVQVWQKNLFKTKLLSNLFLFFFGPIPELLSFSNIFLFKVGVN